MGQKVKIDFWKSLWYDLKYMNQSQVSESVERLKEYFEQQADILLAFVFGSVAAGFAGEDSDFDVAVYLKDADKEIKIWRDISRIIKKEIDLVRLNDAPATLVSNVLKTGIPLTIKDRNLYWQFYLNASSEAEDFANFAKEYWDVYRRSYSLVPEDKARLLERVQFLKIEVQDICEFEELTFNEYRGDRTKRRNIERWVENICNATLDIAKIILASEKKQMPRTYEQALTDFGCLIGLEEKEVEVFVSFARLRNILAHEYLEVLYERIQDFIKKYPSLYDKVFAYLDNIIDFDLSGHAGEVNV